MAYTINLTHRGPQVIESIDLFDEGRYGADKLFFRGNFCCNKCLAEQVKILLGSDELDDEKLKEMYPGVTIDDTFKAIKLGIGNPLKDMNKVGIEKCPLIALNRYHIPNKKFWNNVVPTDVVDPYKASAAVRFSIRVHFRDDFAYIDFGCPWTTTKKYNPVSGTLDDVSGSEQFIKEFKLLQCHFISKEDAIAIIKSIFPTSYSSDEAHVTSIEEEIMTTELIDEDGSIIAL